jgi:ATP-dependent helicase/nuclease subunit B
MQNKLYRISPQQNYLKLLEDFISEKCDSNPLQICKAVLILPNRRSTLKIREYFLENSKLNVSFLPKIISVTEINEGNFESDFESLNQFNKLSKAISSEKRLLIFSKLIRDNSSKFNLEKINFEASLKLASSLASLLDDMQKYQVSSSAINQILPEELSAHKQISLQFINFVAEEYSKLLQQENLIDTAEKLNLTLSHYCNYIKNHATEKIFIAGSTGSIPATRSLIKSIFEYKNGFVILPFIDVCLNNHDWHQIAEENNATHHQRQLYKLLDYIKQDRSSIETISQAQSPLETQISDIYRPATTISSWHNSRSNNKNIDFIKYIKAENPLAEAKIISIIINQQLQQNKSVAIVCNNKNLINKISEYLSKFNIEIDNSFGQSLSQSAEANLFLNLTELISKDFAVLDLLNILKQNSAKDFLSNIYNLEIFIRKNNIKNLNEIISHKDFNNFPAQLKEIFLKISDISKKCYAESDLTKLLQATFELINLISPQLDISSNENWKNINDLLLNFIETGSYHIEKDLFASSIQFLFSTKKIWQKYKSGKKVVALSPIEARLQNFDCVIIADLNQGSWPDEKFSPWLSKGMFKQMGFSPEQDYLSLSSHDFVALLHTPQVFITKSEYINGDLTIDSSFLIRLKTYYKFLYNKELKPINDYNLTLENLNGNYSPKKSYKKPYPKPPLEARFNNISVTDIDKILQNPYAIYAKKILGLYKLDEIEREISFSDYGNFCHKLLENFTQIHQLDISKITDKNFDIALSQTYDLFVQNNSANPAWKSQLNQIKQWFLQIERRDIANIKQLIAEEKINYQIPNTPFSITCKADRIELTKDNKINIADYKTGGFPSKKEIEDLKSSQLILAAWLIRQNAIALNSDDFSLADIIYYNFSFSNGGPEKKIYKLDLEDLSAQADVQLKNLVSDIQNPQKPFLVNPHGNKILKYDDYIHLERIEKGSRE